MQEQHTERQLIRWLSVGNFLNFNINYRNNSETVTKKKKQTQAEQTANSGLNEILEFYSIVLEFILNIDNQIDNDIMFYDLSHAIPYAVRKLEKSNSTRMCGNAVNENRFAGYYVKLDTRRTVEIRGATIK